MPDVARTDAHTARREVATDRAWLICAYEDRQRCRDLAERGFTRVSALEGGVEAWRRQGYPMAA